ncbi:hypothetical protein C8J57DRAFT_1364815 [Mycena rebaudengoi]|nr:hypothetical protein C8J57DRAFT_1364815 [Mycena rebaudengoi]
MTRPRLVSPSRCYQLFLLATLFQVQGNLGNLLGSGLILNGLLGLGVDSRRSSTVSVSGPSRWTRPHLVLAYVLILIQLILIQGLSLSACGYVGRLLADVQVLVTNLPDNLGFRLRAHRSSRTSPR